MPRGRKKKQQEPVEPVVQKPLFDPSLPPVPFDKGNRVLVRGVEEDGSEDFFGQVVSVKWSRQSGWWVDVRRDDNGMNYSSKPEFMDLVVEDIDAEATV